MIGPDLTDSCKVRDLTSFSLSLSLEFYFLCESDMELVFRRGGKIPFNTCQYLLFPSDPQKKKKKPTFSSSLFYYFILFLLLH